MPLSALLQQIFLVQVQTAGFFAPAEAARQNQQQPVLLRLPSSSILFLPKLHLRTETPSPDCDFITSFALMLDIVHPKRAASMLQSPALL